MIRYLLLLFFLMSSNISLYTMQAVKKVFVCPQCGCDKYTAVKSFKDHLLSHIDAEVFSCPGCTIACTRFTSIIDHVSTKHPQQSAEFITRLRDKIARAREQLAAHFPQLFDSNNRFICPEKNDKKKINKNEGIGEFFDCLDPECQARFTNKQHRDTHLLIHVDATVFHCPGWECDASCSRRDLLMRHIDEKHKGQKEYMSTLIDEKIAKAKLQLKTVFPQLAKRYIKSSKSNKFICQIDGCTESFFTKKSYDDHVLTHYDSSLFDCSWCVVRKTRKDAIQQHVKKKHEDQFVEFCKALDLKIANAKIAKLKGNIEQLKRASSEQEIKEIIAVDPICSYCQRKCRSEEELIEHRKIHKKQCDMCRKMCSPTIFWEHRVTHLQKDLFHCTECKHPYALLKASLNHTKTHPAKAEQLRAELMARYRLKIEELKQCQKNMFEDLDLNQLDNASFVQTYNQVFFMDDSIDQLTNSDVIDEYGRLETSQEQAEYGMTIFNVNQTAVIIDSKKRLRDNPVEERLLKYAKIKE